MQRAVGVGLKQGRVVLYFAESTKSGDRLFVSESTDGVKFATKRTPITLRPAVRQIVEAGQFAAVRLSHFGQDPIATFLKTSSAGYFLYQADAKEGDYFKSARLIKKISEPAAQIEVGKKRVMYFGEKNIKYAEAGVRGAWKIQTKPLLEPRTNFFDNHSITIGQPRLTDQGILLTYYARFSEGENNLVTVGAALFDKDKPNKLLWRADHPVWQQPKGFRHLKMRVVGEVDFLGRSLLFLQSERGDIYTVTLHLLTYASRSKRAGRLPHLERSHKNPVLMPKRENVWETKATFNPTAFYSHGRVHLIYRAIGEDDISSFGYASSRDGVHFDERLSYPIYTPRESFEGQCLKQHRPATPSAYASGGSGIGGCEDPRVTLFEHIVYLVYVAFDGHNPPRVALSTLSEQDFLKHNWNWTKPVLISPYIPGEGNKNACVLPEKINGKYVVFHRIWPDILIDYVDDLDFDGKKKFLSKKGHAKIKPRKLHWDSRKVGIGATPLKTESGWLLIYQAVGKQDGGKYKIGAMLLDLKDPSKVIARAHIPVLEPEAWYENEGWKYGVVYPCGAVIVGDDLFVYYGGADTYTCVAKANLADFISHLLTHTPPRLDTVEA